MVEDILLGTYTRSESKGIYKITLNTEKKRLENLKEIAQLGNPTYLDSSLNKELLFAVSSKDNKGGLQSLSLDQDGQYTPVHEKLFDGSAPCYLSYDEKRKLVYTANYHQGTLSVYQTDEQGVFNLTDSIQHQGSSTHKNQQSPHAHYFDCTPDEKYVLACDLGTDEIYTYQVTDEGKISEVSRFKVKNGFGPRHLLFHPKKNCLYVFGELSSEMLVLDYDPKDGSFTEKQVISTLPEGFNGENSGAAIRISHDGKFLYASNRGHNSIVTFEIDNQGFLKYVNHVKTLGDLPRDFNLSKDDHFLVVGHQKTPNLTLYERDETTGQLSLIQKDVYAPEVVNVHFL